MTAQERNNMYLEIYNLKDSFDSRLHKLSSEILIKEFNLILDITDADSIEVGSAWCFADDGYPEFTFYKVVGPYTTYLDMDELEGDEKQCALFGILDDVRGFLVDFGHYFLSYETQDTLVATRNHLEIK